MKKLLKGWFTIFLSLAIGFNLTSVSALNSPATGEIINTWIIVAIITVAIILMIIAYLFKLKKK